MDPQIFQVLTYPNPVSASEIMNIRIEYDRPDEIIQTSVYLYDISGHLLSVTEQKGADNLQWNISELGMHAGVYIYQVKIKTQTSNYVSKAGKIIVSQ